MDVFEKERSGSCIQSASRLISLPFLPEFQQLASDLVIHVSGLLG